MTSYASTQKKQLSDTKMNGKGTSFNRDAAHYNNVIDIQFIIIVQWMGGLKLKMPNSTPCAELLLHAPILTGVEL